MALGITWIVGVLVLNLLFGTLLVLGAFKLMEWRLEVGALGGIAVGTAVVYAEATMGEQLLTVTVSEMKMLVIAAALGAVLGVVSTVIVVEPEL
jgi:hypothetical protein